jgi:hypothetical protein
MARSVSAFLFERGKEINSDIQCNLEGLDCKLCSWPSFYLFVVVPD